jgi:hypothetical protein
MWNDSPCILWTGLLNEDGYGKRGSRLAHRVAYEEQVGPIPEGLEMDHLCRVRNCVNVQHLEPVTHQENCRRGIHWSSKKTHCPKGHPLDYHWRGKRLCSTCRRTTRLAAAAKKPCKCGREYTRTQSGRRICVPCQSAAGKRGMDVRWHQLT